MRPYGCRAGAAASTITDSKVAVSESPRRLNLDGRLDAAAIPAGPRPPIYMRLEAPGRQAVGVAWFVV
jgi:hypothetical protein